LSVAAGKDSGRLGLLSRGALRMLILLSRLPYPLLARVGAALGTLMWWFALPRRRIALVNLAMCFPDLEQGQRRRLAHEHFRWFMRSFVDRFIFWFGPPERIAALVRIEGREHLEACLGRPLIILAPHFVGIDGGGMRLAMEHPFVTVYARQKNAVLDEAMHRGRTRFAGGIALPRQQGVRAALRHLRAGLPFYYLPDMDLGPRDAVFVPFFGVPAATVTATARLAQMTGARVLPFVTRMTADGYVGTFYPPWDDFPGEDLVAATRRMNAFIEQRVLEMPAQYLWTHKRFKSRPPGEPSPYRPGH
jgi:Kdo2-lipid IVA lauroyltransferase/acyltransferase